jgi:predicted Zn-dependent protease
MLTRDQAAGLFSQIKKHSTADEVEAYFYGGQSALTRFANNVIHQNVADENYGVSVRTNFGGRTARASTNKLDEESLKRVVLASESLAKVQHPDPDLLPMPTSQERDAASTMRGPLPSRHFAETAAITPEERAAAVGRMVAIANRHKLTTAGTYSNSESIEGIFNSRGLSDWHTQTSAEASVTMIARFLGLAESELAERARLGRVVVSRDGCAKGDQFSCPKRDCCRNVHRHPRARGGARYCRLHVLGFQRPGHSR